MFRFALIFAISCSLPCTYAQTLDGPSAHHHHIQNVIDGSVHPELIPESDAKRLLLIALAGPLADQNGDITAGIRRVHFNKMRLSSDDQETFSEVLDQFKANYQFFLSKYNEAVEVAIKSGGSTDTETWLVQRDNLVQNTYEQLNRSLSTQGVASLDVHVEAEKAHMKVAQH